MNNVAILPAWLNRPIYHQALQINSIHQLFVSSGLLMRRDIAQGSLIINVWMQPEPDTRAGELKHYSLSCSLSPPTCPSQQHSHYSNEAMEATLRQGIVEEVEGWERTKYKRRNAGVEKFQRSLHLTLSDSIYFIFFKKTNIAFIYLEYMYMLPTARTKFKGA